MPDRIVRAAILSSDPVNSLGWAEEVFYRRLMSVVDDYGRFDGRPSVLRAYLYPLKLDAVSERDVGKWLLVTAKAGLVKLYSVDGKEYVQVEKFGQRTRAMTSKFPDPPTSDNIRRHLTADDSGCPPNSYSYSESYAQSNAETVIPPLPPEGGDDPGGKPPKPKREPKRVSGGLAIIPEILRTAEFEIAWAAWLAEKLDRGQLLTQRGWDAQLAKLAGFGPAVAAKAINDSLANGWQGLFPEKVQNVGTGITHGGGRAGGQQTLLDREQQREGEQLGTIKGWLDKRTVPAGGLREVDGAPLCVEADGTTDGPAT